MVLQFKLDFNYEQFSVVTCSIDHFPSKNWKSPSVILNSISRFFPEAKISISFSKQSEIALALNFRPSGKFCYPICSINKSEIRFYLKKKLRINSRNQNNNTWKSRAKLSNICQGWWLVWSLKWHLDIAVMHSTFTEHI